MISTSTSQKQRRRVLMGGASVCAVASAVLFAFRPVPPIGLYAALGLSVETACILGVLFFPRMVQRIRQSVQRELEKEPRHTNEGQFVP